MSESAQEATGATESPSEGSENTPEYKPSIAIVYPVSWPSPTRKVPDPHSTIIFLGNVEDAEFTKDDVLDVVESFIWTPFDVAIGEVKMFGENNDVPVVTLLSDTLYQNRQALEEELNANGIYDASEFSYSPHITVDPQSMSAMPFHSVRLGKPEIWWGRTT